MVTRWSCSRPTATSTASTHCMGLRRHVDTHLRRCARARAVPRSVRCILGARAIGDAHANVAVALQGAAPPAAAPRQPSA
eukprot:6340860-Prymnesium_polylepis.1